MDVRRVLGVVRIDGVDHGLRLEAGGGAVEIDERLSESIGRAEDRKVGPQTPGVEARPFPELSEPDFLDFNEVFFTDALVPRGNLLGELNGGWPITQGSLAHERAMLWIDYAYDSKPSSSRRSARSLPPLVTMRPAART